MITAQVALSPESTIFLWYQGLTTLQRLSVNCWLTTGDPRLLFFVFPDFAKHYQYLARVLSTPCG